MIYAAAIADITGSHELIPPGATAIQVQNVLRHVMSEAISSEVINCLIVTNSSEANVQLTRIHEHLFSRESAAHANRGASQLTRRGTIGNPMVACVWRRQTFSAAVESCDPDMAHSILKYQMPEVSAILGDSIKRAISVLEDAYIFSSMLHSANSNSGGTSDAFYRAFVPEMGSALLPLQIELIRRCLKSERGEGDRVGATIFPGLVKVTRGSRSTSNSQEQENVQTTVRRAQVICMCALNATGATSLDH